MIYKLIYLNLLLYTLSGVTDKGHMDKSPPAKLNVKTGPQLSLYFSFSLVLVFNLQRDHT